MSLKGFLHYPVLGGSRRWAWLERVLGLGAFSGASKALSLFGLGFRGLGLRV